MEKGKTVSEEKEDQNKKVSGRHYSKAERKAIVARIEAGELTVDEAMAACGIGARKTIYAWITTYGSPGASALVNKHYRTGHRNHIALQVQAGMLSVEEAARQNSVSVGTILGWITKSGAQQGTAQGSATKMNDTSTTNAADQYRSADIESLRLKVAALETMIDLAEEHFKIDIRKKCGTKQQ